MFFGYGFLLLLVAISYSFFRVKGLFPTKRHRIIFTVVYWVFAPSFPWIEILSHSAAPAWTNQLLLVGYLSLPYLLYLFLSVLLFDILKGINRLTKTVPPASLKTGRTATISAATLLVLPAVIVLVGMVRNNELRVNESRIEIPRRASPPKEWTIAVASDFHLGALTDRSFMPRFVEKVNALDADLLLLVGDVLEGDRDRIRTEEFAQQFRSIQTRYGVYGSPGNHESYGRGNKFAFFQSSGITILQDSAALIDGSLLLIGRKDGRSQDRKPIGSLARAVGDSLPVLVLDHRPTELDSISASGADISVSGHTHDGQLWPLNYITGSIYEVSWGYKRKGALHAFVTSGVQVWGPPARTAGDSEIMVLRVAVK